MPNEKLNSSAIKNSINEMRATGMSMSSLMLDATEKATLLNMEAARSYLTHSLAITKDLMSAQDVNEYLARASAAVKGNIERTLTYGRQVRASCFEVTGELNNLAKAAVPSQTQDRS